MSTRNQRKFTRVGARLKCTLYTEHGPSEGFVGNMSMGGIYIVTDLKPPMGMSCNVFIRLADSSNALSIQISGTVVRHDEEGVGVRMDQVAFEAFQHLSRLVLLNSDDPDEVENEMESHVGLRPKTGKDRRKGTSSGK